MRGTTKKGYEGLCCKTFYAHRFLLLEMDEDGLRLLLAFGREARRIGDEEFFLGLEGLMLLWHFLQHHPNLVEPPGGHL